MSVGLLYTIWNEEQYILDNRQNRLRYIKDTEKLIIIIIIIVVVIAVGAGTINLALGKPATQSSTYLR